MKRTLIIAAFAVAIVAGFAIPQAGADGALIDLVGTGEKLAIVVAGEYTTEVAASAANESIVLDDMQGFYVAPSGWFEGKLPGKYLLVSAFRTTAGANDFLDLVENAGYAAAIQVMRYLGTSEIGLGQEPAPDGSGPLLTDLPDGGEFAA